MSEVDACALKITALRGVGVAVGEQLYLDDAERSPEWLIGFRLGTTMRATPSTVDATQLSHMRRASTMRSLRRTPKDMLSEVTVRSNRRIPLWGNPKGLHIISSSAIALASSICDENHYSA
jgi:hypothetical protein